MPDPTPPGPRAASLPTPVFTHERATLYHGDSVEFLRLLPEASVDALVSDPPYGLSFNGQAWDDASGFRESLPHIDTTAMSAPEVFEAWCTEWPAGKPQHSRRLGIVRTLPASSVTSSASVRTRAQPESRNTIFTAATLTAPEGACAICSRTTRGTPLGVNRLDSDVTDADPGSGREHRSMCTPFSGAGLRVFG